MPLDELWPLREPDITDVANFVFHHFFFQDHEYQYHKVCNGAIGGVGRHATIFLVADLVGAVKSELFSSSLQSFAEW